MSVRCFVIGPIGNRFGELGSDELQTYEDALEVLEKVIEPACRANDIEPVRADQITASGDINDQVFRHLRDDEIVIADLSGANANVMYELGIRHTTSKLTIVLGEFGQLPFDVKAIRTIEFSRSRSGLVDARKALEKALSTGLVEGGDQIPVARIFNELPDEVPAVAQSGPSREASEKEVGGSEDDELGPLDQLEVIEETFPALTETTEEIGETMEEIGTLSFEATERIQKAESTSAGARLALLSSFAKELEEPTTRIEALASTYSDHLSKVDSAMRAVIVELHKDPREAQDERVQGFLNELRSMAANSREALEGINSFGSSASEMGAISKRLRRPGRRLQAAARVMASATSKIDEWDRQVVPLLRSVVNDPERE